jgi:hypothetical protein
VYRKPHSLQGSGQQAVQLEAKPTPPLSDDFLEQEIPLQANGTTPMNVQIFKRHPQQVG